MKNSLTIINGSIFNINIKISLEILFHRVFIYDSSIQTQ